MVRPRAHSDEAILAALRKHIRSSGPGVSLSGVARELGVSEPALFKRFGSRKAMLLRALGSSIDLSFLESLRQGPHGGALKPQLRAIFAALASFFEGAIPSLMALRESGIPHEELLAQFDQPPPLQVIEAIVQWLRRARRLGLVRGVSPESAALAMLGALQSRAFLEHLLSASPIARSRRSYVSDLADLFSRALAP